MGAPLSVSQPLCPRLQLRRRSRRSAACAAAAGAPQQQPPPATSATPRSQPQHAARAARVTHCAASQPAPPAPEPALARRSALAALSALLPLSAAAAGPARAEEVETVEILMAAMSFVPSRVVLKRNKPYRLVLTNPSKIYHNFVATVRRRRPLAHTLPNADSPPAVQEFLLHGAYWLLTKIGEAGETEWCVGPSSAQPGRA